MNLKSILQLIAVRNPPLKVSVPERQKALLRLSLERAFIGDDYYKNNRLYMYTHGTYLSSWSEFATTNVCPPGTLL